MKKDIPKTKTPLFFTLKSLSNKEQLFFYFIGTLSQILLLRCDAPGNKTDEEKGCRLKIEIVPSWRKNFYLGRENG